MLIWKSLFSAEQEKDILDHYALFKVGNSAVLKCRVYSNHIIPFWIFDNPTLDQKLNVTKSGNFLLMNNLSISDSGTYTCVFASDHLGFMSDSSFIARAVIKVLGNTDIYSVILGWEYIYNNIFLAVTIKKKAIIIDSFALSSFITHSGLDIIVTIIMFE